MLTVTLLVLALLATSCAQQVSQDEMAREAAQANQTIETFNEVDNSLEKIASDLLVSSLAEANELANTALMALKKRRHGLLEERLRCSRLKTVALRRPCFAAVISQMSTIRKERQLVEALGRCNMRGDMGELVRCVTQTRLRHSLLTPDGVKHVAKSGDRLVSSISRAIEAVNLGSSRAEEDAEEAVHEVRERLERLASHWSNCEAMEAPAMRSACRQGVLALRKENKMERHLLHRLESCGEIYAFEDGARRRCTKLIGQKILRLVRFKNAPTTAPIVVSDTTAQPVVNKMPGNLEELHLTELHARTAIEDRITSLHNAMKSCNRTDFPCKVRLHKLLARARDELNALDARFEPRKKCLTERKRFQMAEFHTRAREHARMFQLHSKAARCETNECLQRWEQLEDRVNRLLAIRRAARMKAWRKIPCYFVLPFAAVAPESKDLATLAGLHFRVHELHQQLKLCITEQCETTTKFLISTLGGQIDRLTRFLKEKSFVERLRRHRSRARINRRFTQLYRKAIGCATLDCRRDTRLVLTDLQDQLDQDELNFDTQKIDDDV